MTSDETTLLCFAHIEDGNSRAGRSTYKVCLPALPACLRGRDSDSMLREQTNTRKGSEISLQGY